MAYDMGSDFQWFLDNYDKLFEQYGACNIVIRDKQVLGTYDSYAEAVQETCKTEKLGTFSVQYCNGDESGYTAYIASENFI